MDENENLFPEKIVSVKIENEMKTSYIDYAMSVIVARALPDVRDGLKPVHRRILYAMDEAGMTSGKPYKKSARIVGEVLGKYHPHGDSSVYDAIVRMAQDFSMRYMLADGHGNFGSVDGDPPAAMRYTEVRMSKVSELMLKDIDKETVDFVPNYDESLKEPSVLPAKFPQLLVNGTSGIAVGMATNIPPHNMTEIINGTLMLIDNPNASIDELMTIIKGPDFPTAGLIMGRGGIKSAYKTGRGVIKMRAEAHIEEMKGGKSMIVATELPYQVNKARLLERIAELVRDKTIDGITDLRDESDRTGMRLVVELRRDANPNVILNQLYKHTKFQESFGVIMLALVDGSPKILNLKQVLHYYIKHQEDVVTRRTRFELKKAEARAHILEGLTIAIDNLDNVIKIIRESEAPEDAKKSLMELFKLSEKQAQAILDMRLQSLTGLQRQKIEDEYEATLKAIEEYKAILADEQKILDIIKTELTEVRDKYGDERRSRIVEDVSDIDDEDLIDETDDVIMLTHRGYVKRMPLAAYKSQKRGGRGIAGMGTKEEDYVENLIITTTLSKVLFFTSKGRVFAVKAYEIMEASRQAKGTNIINLLSLNEGEKITAMIPIKEFLPDRFLFMATKKGVVKKTPLEAYKNANKNGLQSIKLDDDDDLIGVKFTDGNRRVILGTKEGIAIVFDEEKVRSMGRVSHGVKGITLRQGDEVVGMANLHKDHEILTVTENGYGKRTPIDDYRITNRGGKGIINLKVTEKTGPVIGLKVVNPEMELMLVTTEGIVIRTTIEDISVVGRNTQGVKIMKTGENDKVASLATFDVKSE